ncbi:MAG TPA: hypothetical protein VMJ70_11055 [Candidatus Sulfotelmatobacter sp.]|nr:hypothetical protein [Candidatus Sulfotelmatobacter sp.]
MNESNRQTVVLCALVALAMFAMVVLGCARHDTMTRELSERERDSLIGASKLVGAPVVARALQESDRAAASASQMNAEVDSLPR